MKAVCTVIWDNDHERDVYRALVHLSRTMDAKTLEENSLVEYAQTKYPEVWDLFRQDRMCGECTGSGGTFIGEPCKICRGEGIVPITVER